MFRAWHLWYAHFQQVYIRNKLVPWPKCPLQLECIKYTPRSTSSNLAPSTRNPGHALRDHFVVQIKAQQKETIGNLFQNLTLPLNWNTKIGTPLGLGWNVLFLTHQKILYWYTLRISYIILKHWMACFLQQGIFLFHYGLQEAARNRGGRTGMEDIDLIKHQRIYTS